MAEGMPTLGEMEMRVLRLVWQLQPCSERQVSDLILAERDVARTTVLKTLQRLEAKQLLERVPGASPVQFRALVEPQRVLPTLVRRFVAERSVDGIRDWHGDRAGHVRRQREHDFQHEHHGVD